MKKVLFTLKMPHESYVGGIATVINGYLGSEAEFVNQGYFVDIFDYVNTKIDNIKPSKVSNVIYGIAQRKKLIKELKSNHEDIIVHIHTSCRYLFFKDVLLARSIKKKYNIPVILSIHVGDISTVFDGIPAKLKKVSFEILNQYVDKTIFLSPNMIKQFVSAGLKKDKAELLLNFHDIPMEMGMESHDDLRMLFVGAIKKEKGIMELLQAIHDLPELKLHLDICGVLTDNNIAADFSRYTNELRDQIHLHGYVKGEEKNALFKNSDVLVLPSYHEGFPLVILEAMATGNAIISTSVGTTPEVFDDENVIWSKVEDVESLKEAIKKLANDDELLKKMKLLNFSEGKKYSKQLHIKKLCDIYDEVSGK